MLARDEVDALFPSDLPEAEHWESLYPPRQLPPGAQVTRFCPSPTGSLHLGGVFVAILDRALARQSGGTYLIRIEDTDQEREVPGAAAEFDRAFGYFDVVADEPADGPYRPYVQSQRSMVYMTYIRDFLRAGKAYLCFCTREDLAALAAQQRAAKVPTGYYGRWAPWREAADDEVRARLAAGESFVVRFRSPGEGAGRISYTDLIRGEISTDDNRNDVVILKSSANELRLPTYHFAHLVDDHLMRVTMVIRADEWISSVPVHLQLFDAAGFERVPYAHIAPLMKQEGSAKRKLSKRKDPEASVEFYIAGGYPVDAVQHYLRGLLNARLADMPIAAALAEPLRLEECGVAGPLVDLVKLESISAGLIAGMPSAEIYEEVLAWARTYDPEVAAAIAADHDLALRALDIERVGVDNPRKDLRKWSDFRPVYGFFFNPLFDLATDPADERFGGLDPAVVKKFCADLLGSHSGWVTADDPVEELRAAAGANGFAPTVRTNKDDPESYIGSFREASNVVRVVLTGSGRSPALQLVVNALGEGEVRRRIGAALSG